MKMNETIRKKYIGKKVNLYPNDTYYKEAIIKDVDEYGWTFLMTEETDNRNRTRCGEVLFINHAKELSFKFID